MCLKCAHHSVRGQIVFTFIYYKSFPTSPLSVAKESTTVEKCECQLWSWCEAPHISTVISLLIHLIGWRGAEWSFWCVISFHHFLGQKLWHRVSSWDVCVYWSWKWDSFVQQDWQYKLLKTTMPIFLFVKSRIFFCWSFKCIWIRGEKWGFHSDLCKWPIILQTLW